MLGFTGVQIAQFWFEMGIFTCLVLWYREYRGWANVENTSEIWVLFCFAFWPIPILWIIISRIVRFVKNVNKAIKNQGNHPGMG